MIRIKAVYVDGSEQETSAGARAEVEFERRFNLAFTDAFHRRVRGEPRARQEWQYFLTYVSLRIDGQVGEEEFDDWLKRLSDVDVLGTEEDPTQRDRRPDKSSSSAL